jgi:hypothetical protein
VPANDMTNQLLHMQRTIGNNAVTAWLQRKTAEKGQDAATDEPGFETVLWVLDDVLAYETNRLIPDLTVRYKGALEKLWQALVGRDMARKKILGRQRRELFDEAVLALRPVLAHASKAQLSLLQSKRSVLLYAEAEDRVDNSLIIDNKVVEIPDDRHPREQAAVLRQHLPKLVQTLTIANEQLLRLGSKQLEETIEHLEKGGHPNTLARLAMLHGVLGMADGWLILTDDELKEQLSNIQGFVPGVTTFGELVKAIIEIGISGVSLTAALAAAIAKATGDAVLASAAVGVAAEAGHLLGNVVAGIEIVHGIFVLLDPKATRAQKERAALGVLSGGAWFVGKRIGGAVVGAAASVAVVATYLELKLAAYLYVQGTMGITTILMREVFEYMQRYGSSMARVAERVASAGLLLQEEHDPIKAAPLAKLQEENAQMLATEIDDFLQNCLSTGKGKGWGSINPAAEPGNYQILVDAFAPLQPFRSAKSGPPLAAAATAVIEKIGWCLAHAGEIVVAGASHRGLKDVEAAAAKASQGPQE